MTEAQVWVKLKKALKEHHPVRIENILVGGTQDVNHAFGWTELKWITGWPKKPDTVVRFTKYTTQQRAFLRDRWNAGGGCSLLLGVGKGRGAEFLLFPGDYAASKCGLVTRAELERIASEHWIGKINKEELVKCLKIFA